MLRIRTFGKVSIEIPFSEASVGDILCSDNKIVAPADYSASGKTAIGIVINKASGVLRIMALTVVGGKWGGYNTNISLDDITTENGAIAETDGEANTLTMISDIGNIPDDTIAITANNYGVSGATSGWYMPAIGEVYMIGQNLSAINTARQAIGLSVIGNYVVILASSEYDAELCWYGYTGSGTFTLNGDLAKGLNMYSTYPLIKKTY